MLLTAAVMAALYSSVNCEDFCTAYRKNNEQISYTYRRVFSDPITTTGKTYHEVIINGQYWTLEFTEPKNLEFSSRSSKDNAIFSGKYSMTACVRTQDNSEWSG